MDCIISSRGTPGVAGCRDRGVVTRTNTFLLGGCAAGFRAAEITGLPVTSGGISNRHLHLYRKEGRKVGTLEGRRNVSGTP